MNLDDECGYNRLEQASEPQECVENDWMKRTQGQTSSARNNVARRNTQYRHALITAVHC